MKRAIIIALLTLPIALNAQDKERQDMGKKEQIRAHKVAHMTTAMELSPEDAQKFWPLYNKMEEELRAAKKERNEMRRSYKESTDGLSDAELEKLLDKELEVKQQELDIRKRYHSQFKETIGVRKTARMYRSEHEFNKRLVKGVRDRFKEQGGPDRPPRPR